MKFKRVLIISILSLLFIPYHMLGVNKEGICINDSISTTTLLSLKDSIKSQNNIQKSSDTIHQQKDIDSLHNDEPFSTKRLTTVIVAGASLYAASMTGLYQLWYKKYPQSKFHFFNDNDEWLKMDKMGHFTTAYYISKAGYGSLKWTGLSENKSILYGGGIGIFYLTVVEILDGFSSQWGFSPGDMTANTLGSSLFIGQQLLWHEQRIQWKWSYHHSPYAKYRPDLLGDKFQEQWLKDYNGQTYWLSANIKSFLQKGNKFPAWLNLAVGYGAEGMTGAARNSTVYNGNPVPPFERYRQFYISGDIDLSRIKTSSKTLNMILNAIGFIKFPFPALEFSRGKTKFHPLYF
jgi:hypothetical protein